MSTTTLVASTPAPTSATDKFAFPPHYAFPPFFTLQPILATRTSQLQSWSAFIQAYCRYHRVFTLTLVDALSTPLFYNAALGRSLSLRDARTIVHWMTTVEGGARAEWIPSTASASAAAAAAAGLAAAATSGSGSGNARKSGKVEEEGDGKVWVYWRRPEEWAQVLEEWVERTGQRGSVITLYEIQESDATRREEFWGMDGELLRRSVGVCVKRGRAQVFGQEGSEGVKFF
ncbi:ESCRT-II complex, vps25 subunit [Melanomma pulvis-pyrius CBS 109.77]|uniref:Vacuolar protein-sorting-associated protein 25 n=1 Tax=Melanomma pulvis-pyrius CBS 109.77 TaxID=1314802 RepID=A0A6A6XCA9_9PLEO|nr:ESCRT-II complex, vps25 subunit [Melanomma pulvis-pyrius CBS 109.77]